MRQDMPEHWKMHVEYDDRSDLSRTGQDPGCLRRLASSQHMFHSLSVVEYRSHSSEDVY